MNIVDKILDLMECDKLPVNIVDILEIDVDTKLGTKFDLCGTYIITTKNGDYYVGFTNNFRRRIYTHKKNIMDIVSIILFETINIDDAMVFEDYIIFTLNPNLNIVGRSDIKREMNSLEISRLKKREQNGNVRRFGLFDMIINSDRQ